MGRRGAYSKAEPLLKEAREIWRKALGEQHPDYAQILDNLAVLYHAMGDYSKAEPLLKEAREIWRKALGEQHPHYAISLRDLALLFAGTVRKVEAFDLVQCPGFRT